MKAIVMHGYGSPDVLRYEDVPVPIPGRGEVLLRIAGTSFNPGDAAMRAGYAGSYAKGFPLVAGFDAAGTIERFGPGVTGWAAGDRVIAYLRRPQDGATGEFATAPVDQLAPAPAHLPLTAAAALPVAGLTAWQAIHDHLRVNPGQDVLITGAGGGVGRLAVQFAKRAGATVVGLAGPASLEAARSAGADEVIDYTKSQPVRHFDAIFHTAPTPALGLERLVRSGGAIISITSRPGERPDIRSGVMEVRADGRQLAEIVRLVDAGVTLGVTEHLPMTELPEVHRRHESRRLHGKVVFSHRPHVLLASAARTD